MSHEATMWAVKIRGISCTEARVLWHLADCHNPIYGCYPKQDYLADACEIDERSVRRCLANLRDKGLINWTEAREGKNRKANRYALGFEPGFRRSRVAVSAENEPDKLSGSNEVSTGQDCTFEPDSGGRLNRTPESSIEPVREPVTEPVTERERGRELSDEDPKKIERDFLRWHPTWPTYPNGSEDAARRRWFELTPEQRAACIEKTPAFIAAIKAKKAGSFTFSSIYLKDRAWEKLEDPKNDLAPPAVFNPFSRAWMALRLSELCKPMATVWPVMTAFQRMKAAESADAAKSVEMERRAKYGWPKVNTMHELALNAKGVSVTGSLVALSEGFEKVHRDSEMASRWKALHERMGWPWLPQTGHEWLYFPAGEPDETIAEFQRRLSEGQGQ